MPATSPSSAGESHSASWARLCAPARPPRSASWMQAALLGLGSSPPADLPSPGRLGVLSRASARARASASAFECARSATAEETPGLPGAPVADAAIAEAGGRGRVKPGPEREGCVCVCGGGGKGQGRSHTSGSFLREVIRVRHLYAHQKYAQRGIRKEQTSGYAPR